MRFGKSWWYGLFILLFVSFLIDNVVLNFFVQNRVEVLNKLAIWLADGFTFLFVVLIFASLFLWNGKKERWILPLWLSAIISYALVILLKFLFVRMRPDVLTLVSPETFYSFPSGHAAIVFSVLPILDKEFPRLKWFWFIFAGLILLSMLYVGVHYLSDLIAGCILGLFIGFLFLKKFSKKKR